MNDEPISPEEYLRRERERETNERFEYIDGWVLAMHEVRPEEVDAAMTGPTLEHNLIVTNVSGELRTHLRSGECRVVAPAPRVPLFSIESYVYPDALVYCGSPEIDETHEDMILNPQLVVEVLSPSTMDYDRGERFWRYRQLDSLQEYVLIAQDRPHVEHYVRQEDGSWIFTETDGLDASIALPSVDAELPLAEIYLDVFDTESRDTRHES